MARLFTRGNKAAKGGRRADAGRKPDTVKKALAEILATPLDWKVDPKQRDLTRLAWDTVAQAMLDRDASGCVTGPGAKAAKDVLDRVHGKPTQAHEVDVSNAPLIQFVSSVARAAEQSRMLGAVTDARSGLRKTP